ncbi:MAG: glycosyltransferase family 39 protein [bacterium]|nr:glycosyltransferase family 39 protein [bacterium]
MTKQLRSLQFILLLVPLTFTLFLFWKFLLLWQVPFRLDYAEGFVYFNSVRILEGQAIYHSITNPPHVPGFYTPVYFSSLASLMVLFGERIEIGRLLSFACYLSSAILVSLIVFQFCKSKFLSIFAGLLFTSSLIISLWAFVIRPDMLAIAIVLLGILYGATKKLDRWYDLPLIALVFALAFFTKQNLVLAPAAVAIWLLLTCRRKGITFVFLYGLFVLIGVAVFSYWTDGSFFQQTFLYAGKVEYSNWYPALRVALITILSTLPFFAIATAASLRKPRELSSIYFFVSLLGFFTLIREGGTINYLLEFVPALIIRSASSDIWFKYLFRWNVLAYLLVVVVLVSQLFSSFSVFPWELKNFRTEKTRFFEAEKKLIISTSGEVLAEDAFLPIAAGKKVFIEPFTFGQVTGSLLVSPKVFYNDLDSGKYELVIEQGAFRNVPDFYEHLEPRFELVYKAKAERKIKGFDYSLYNLNQYSGFGEVYQFAAKKEQN